MAFSDLFKPKWKHSDPNVRRAATEKITDQEVLTDIAKNDTDLGIRKTAIKKITDQEVLTDIAKNDTDLGIRKVATEKITDQEVLADIAKNDTDLGIRKTAIKKITDQEVLADIAKNDRDLGIHEIAIERLSKIVLGGDWDWDGRSGEAKLAANKLIDLGAIDLLVQLCSDQIDTEQEYGICHREILKLITETVIKTRNLKLLKKLLITETYYIFSDGFLCEVDGLLEELEEEEILDIYISAISPEARVVACHALGRVGGLAAFSLLKNVASKGIRAALTALDRDDANRALEKINLNLWGDHEPCPAMDEPRNDGKTAKGFAKDALRNIITRLPLEQLLPLCENDQTYIRHPALIAVCRVADLNTMPVLISASQAEDPHVVASAVNALSKVGGPDSLHALLPLLKHHSHQVWTSAACALSKTGSSEAVAGIIALQPERILDPVVLEGLARLGAVKQASDVLRTALQKAPRENKATALEILDKNVPTDEVALFQNVFAEAYKADLIDAEWIVRRRAVEALGRIGGQLAMTVLQERLKIEVDYEIQTCIEEVLDSTSNDDALMATPSFVDYQRGCELANAGETLRAIQEFTKAIEKDNHPMAYYCRAVSYKDLRKFKKAIEDFRSYLKYGSKTTPEGIASRFTIEELEEKLKLPAKPQGKQSNVLCPVCKFHLFIVEENVGGFKGSLRLECPECGLTGVKP